MKLTNGEKLILWMLADLSDKAGVQNGVNTNLVREAVSGGHAWALEWEMTGIFGANETDDATVSEVVNLLDMWDLIEMSYEALSPAGKDKLAAGAEPFGKDPKFRGFDGNSETEHMSVARMLIKHMNRFQRFAGRNLNSHMSSIGVYLRMYEVFLPMRASLADRLFSDDELIEILKARVHPDSKA